MKVRLLYRGWMLSGEEYEALDERGHALMTTPSECAAAHYLPNWYPRLKGYTARSVWTEGTDASEAWEAARELGSPPWLVKDHVRSAKERWAEACFVPAGATREDFERICGNLLEERGDRFERGFVVRRFLLLGLRAARTEDRGALLHASIDPRELFAALLGVER
ncbi:MAG TPA: ATP-grasp domain-containing protein [Archangium sp.]|nr:ATP-grasp domain-containing protein [Archangium sp.]